MQVLTERNCSFEDGQPRYRSVEVKLVPCRATLKALVNVPFQVGREGPAPGRAKAMHRARSAHLFRPATGTSLDDHG